MPHSNPSDPHDLQRFVDAQSGVFDQVMAELSAGHKASHWMWFVFPQLRGLGHSPMAQRYGLADRAEALAYWRHPLLGPRLRHCCTLLMALQGKTAHDILGSPDDLKLRSCMTLFEQVDPAEPLFAAVLDRHCAGERDEHTLALLSHSSSEP